jgi:hypothetical protein
MLLPFLRAAAACYSYGRTMKMNEPIKPSDTESKTAPRRSFLLRLWCSNAQGATCWQASLEDPLTGERIGFANLEHLFAYLMELTEGHAKHDT